ncbi:inositol monophosphatase family protein [Sunxiuqinia elliptica]|uniref:3'(2'), 5'-bisphosphate nucleotidase/myo-inositol-1(Or 4)-monophosphatase n=1 Tax=Sunxiuqinia elliptica TaxID=655355 RepID=A0A1I2BM55_9BACT|nr:inositol monophosphatase family protein [Sunxiuqinia elliptica]SFE56888.1 3'(2'), 5'-bisphosphate nucleotidase/myo-inositol-1(or 4)-monophosphatase [Sunxiuqinia elliptica]
MKRYSQDLQVLSQAASNAAQKAGQLISNYTTKELTVKNKTGGDSLASQVVTEVDLMAQEMILESLAEVTQNYDLGTLGEESPDNHERFEKDYFWCIDPMDGTLAFIKQQHGYAVSIGLVSKAGEPVIGVIYDPMTQTMYQAVKGQGAFRNGQKWTVAIPADTPLHLISDTSFQDHALFETSLEALEAISKKLGYHGFQTRFQGGAALNACWVLEQAPACYFKYAKEEPGGGSLWDYAASACIYQEAQAWVSDMHGQPLDLNRSDSTFMNHRGILYATDEKLAQELIALSKKVNHS